MNLQGNQLVDHKIDYSTFQRTRKLETVVLAHIQSSSDSIK